jgi:hypothetical protein
VDAEPRSESPAAPVSADQFVPAYLAALQADRPGTYGTIVAQGRGVELRGDKVVIKAAGAFVANQANSNKPWLESIAQKVAGRRLPVVVEIVDAGPSGGGAEPAAARGPGKDELMAAAKANPAVQTVLEIFPAEVKDVTELK